MMRSVLLSFTAAALFLSLSLHFATASECEVCESVITKLEASLTAEEKKDVSAIEAKIAAFCESVTDYKEDKLCYYIDTVKRDVSKPLSEGLPVERICERLGKKDGSICALRYPVDLASLDPESMRIKEVRRILAENGATCKGCTEKHEFVNKLKELIQKKKDEL